LFVLYPGEGRNETIVELLIAIPLRAFSSISGQSLEIFYQLLLSLRDSKKLHSTTRTTLARASSDYSLRPYNWPSTANDKIAEATVSTLGDCFTTTMVEQRSTVPRREQCDIVRFLLS
jgi:hypothetical protein